MYTFKHLEEKFMPCPFNKQHLVKASRMQYHIAKCQKNYPDFLTCPYNACHRMKKEDYSQHEKECPDRILVQKILTIPHRDEKEHCRDYLTVENDLESGENWNEP